MSTESSDNTPARVEPAWHLEDVVGRSVHPPVTVRREGVGRLALDLAFFADFPTNGPPVTMQAGLHGAASKEIVEAAAALAQTGPAFLAFADTGDEMESLRKELAVAEARVRELEAKRDGIRASAGSGLAEQLRQVAEAIRDAEAKRDNAAELIDHLEPVFAERKVKALAELGQHLHAAREPVKQRYDRRRRELMAEVVSRCGSLLTDLARAHEGGTEVLRTFSDPATAVPMLLAATLEARKAARQQVANAPAPKPKKARPAAATAPEPEAPPAGGEQ